MTAVAFLLGLLVAPASSAAWLPVLRVPRGRRFRVWLAGWISGCAGGGLTAVIFRDWPWASGAALSLAVALAVRWRRRRRDRVRALIGAKSRALRDALAARMPRPVVLRPVRGGAS